MASSPNSFGAAVPSSQATSLPGTHVLQEPATLAHWDLRSPAQASAPPWKWVPSAACRACAQGPGAPHRPPRREPAPGVGGPSELLPEPSTASSKPTGAGRVPGCHEPHGGGHRNPGLPDEEFAGLTAPGGVQQGWDAPQSVSHGPPDSSPRRSVQSSAVSWKPLPVYTALGFVKILTLLEGKWKKPDEMFFSLATGHVRGSKCDLPACSGPRLMTTPGREGRSPAQACGKHSEIRESAGRERPGHVNERP